MTPFQQNVLNLYDQYFFIDLVYGIVWLAFLVYGGQPGELFSYSCTSWIKSKYLYQTTKLNSGL